MAVLPFEDFPKLHALQNHPASFLTLCTWMLTSTLAPGWEKAGCQRCSPSSRLHSTKVRQSKYPGQMFSLHK